MADLMGASAAYSSTPIAIPINVQTNLLTAPESSSPRAAAKLFIFCYAQITLGNTPGQSQQYVYPAHGGAQLNGQTMNGENIITGAGLVTPYFCLMVFPRNQTDPMYAGVVDSLGAIFAWRDFGAGTNPTLQQCAVLELFLQ